eukprot:gene29802-36909_t
MAIETALPYFEYGNALLTAEEENPDHDVLGNVEQDKNSGDKNVEEETDEKDEEEEEGPSAGGDEEGNGEEEEDEPEGDMQIAWELIEIHVRLGDLLRFNDNLPDAIVEYEKALVIRNKICEKHDTLLSDVHFSLAVVYIYNANEKDSGVNPVLERKKALVHYTTAKEILQLWLAANKASPDFDFMSENVDMLQETIDALESDIKEE